MTGAAALNVHGLAALGFQIENMALKIAAGGTKVAFVSGFSPKDFLKCLKGQTFNGTIVKVA